MANFYKILDSAKDVVSTRTLLHEAIPLTGTIVSGTYSDENIKNYSHGMFQSVYDYPFLSSSANHIFDITIGLGTESAIYSTANKQAAKKKNIYNQMAQVLMGYDHTGSVLRFDEDGDITGGGEKLDDVVFINFSRLLVKDEIKKGSFQLELSVSGNYEQPGAMMAENNRIKITDSSGSSGYLVNSPAGEYGVLYATASAAGSRILAENANQACGLLFYQAGVAVLSSSVFLSSSAGGLLNMHTSPAGVYGGQVKVTNSSGSLMDGPTNTNEDFRAVLTGSEISGAADNIRNRIYNLQFNNTVELNSTVYFCRMNHNEFNYSTNPTYLSSSQIRVKTKSTDTPIAYVTSIGLYNSNNELLGVAKLSEPLRKDPSQEYTIRCRLDF
jgi:hypothetical protein